MTRAINEDPTFHAVSTIFAECPKSTDIMLVFGTDYHRHYYEDSPLYGRPAISYLGETARPIAEEIQLALLEHCDIMATVKTSVRQAFYEAAKLGIIPLEVKLPTDSGGALANYLTLHGESYCRAIASGIIKGVKP